MMSGLQQVPDISHDAVVVIPGIMGSRLVDTKTHETVWGLNDPRWYVRAWSRGDGLERLDAARYGPSRIKPNGLLKAPAFAPWLAGLEPYTKLIEGIKRVVADRAAILEFSYDWRLPVEHNARLLAKEAVDHLAAWRQHPFQKKARRWDPDGRPARLVLVAHSMGGLLAQSVALPYLGNESGLDPEDLRATITLGTPFYGAVKAAMILNSGRGAPVPLPRERLRKLAVTLPGLYDLLPTYRCVDTGTDAVRLTVSDLQALGGLHHLAQQSIDFHARLCRVQPHEHRSVIGVEQQTLQSLRLRGGVVYGSYEAYRQGPSGLLRSNRGGDGTVYRDSAETTSANALPQQHGMLAKAPEAIAYVRAVITGRDKGYGPLLGSGGLGLSVPDVVDSGVAWTFAVTGLDHPAGAVCEVYDLAEGRLLDMPGLYWADGEIRAAVQPLPPGLYRVVATGGGTAPITQLVMVTDAG